MFSSSEGEFSQVAGRSPISRTQAKPRSKVQGSDRIREVHVFQRLIVRRQEFESLQLRRPLQIAQRDITSGMEGENAQRGRGDPATALEISLAARKLIWLIVNHPLPHM